MYVLPVLWIVSCATCVGRFATKKARESTHFFKRGRSSRPRPHLPILSISAAACLVLTACAWGRCFSPTPAPHLCCPHSLFTQPAATQSPPALSILFFTQPQPPPNPRPHSLSLLSVSLSSLSLSDAPPRPVSVRRISLERKLSREEVTPRDVDSLLGSMNGSTSGATQGEEGDEEVRPGVRGGGRGVHPCVPPSSAASRDPRTKRPRDL